MVKYPVPHPISATVWAVVRGNRERIFSGGKVWRLSWLSNKAFRDGSNFLRILSFLILPTLDNVIATKIGTTHSGTGLWPVRTGETPVPLIHIEIIFSYSVASIAN